MISKIRIRRLLGLAIAATTAFSTFGIHPANAIDETVSFAEAMAYAESGLKEPYTYAGMWWYDNDSFVGDADGDGELDPQNFDPINPYEQGHNAKLREGPDCSGYVMKVWAVASYSAPNNEVSRVYNGESYYSGTWHQNENHYDQYGRLEWKKQTFDQLAPLDVIVWKYPKGTKPPGHIVLYMGKNDAGKILTWEAKGSRYGTKEHTNNAAFYKESRMRYRQRATWVVQCRQCVE